MAKKQEDNKVNMEYVKLGPQAEGFTDASQQDPESRYLTKGQVKKLNTSSPKAKQWIRAGGLEVTTEKEAIEAKKKEQEQKAKLIEEKKANAKGTLDNLSKEFKQLASQINEKDK